MQWEDSPTKWRCTVCGYIHAGTEPPAVCPVCGADRSQFLLLGGEKALLRDLVDTFVLHPVAAHFPNGLVPTALFFLLLTILTRSVHLEHAIFYLLGVVLAVVPISLASGIYDWRTRFSGEKAPIFTRKIVLGVLLLLLSASAVGLRFARPALVLEGGILRLVYIALLLSMLPAVILLGHYGAKLAARRHKREP